MPGAFDSETMRREWCVQLARQLFAQADEDDVAGLAAEIAFRTFLELFPLVIFLAAIGSVFESTLHVQNPTQLMLQMLTESLPQGTADPIRQQLEGVLQSQQGAVGLPMIGVLWLAAGGGATLLKAMNRIYEIEETRSFWHRYLVGLWLTLVGSAVMLLTLIFVAVGQLTKQQVGGDEAPAWFWALAGFIRWPMLLLILLLEAGIAYRVAPNARPRWRFITPGALLFAVGWLMASSLFVLYVDKAGGYAATYGFLGGVVVLLLWLQITAYALLLGAELNDLLEHPAKHPARAWNRHARRSRRLAST